MSFFSKVWSYIEHFFSPVKQAILKVADPGLHAIEQELGEAGLKAVQAAVAAAEALGGSGAEKFEAAKASLETSLKETVAVVKPNVLNLAIELVVAALKAVV